MLWFIGVWATVHDILAIKKFADPAEIPQKFFDSKHSYLWNTKSQHNKQHQFLQVLNETFQMHACKLL